jgi:alpha-D-ribose 1-methylphosphonate 5-triphosphate diphosphatase
MAIVVGAPNVVRGGSQSGNLAAHELIADGLADIICADYHAPSLLAAVLKIVRDGLLDLPTAVRMVTLNAAHAVGLTDRGAIHPGLRADLTLVRLDEHGFPVVDAVFTRGEQKYAYGRGAVTNQNEAIGTGAIHDRE